VRFRIGAIVSEIARQAMPPLAPQLAGVTKARRFWVSWTGESWKKTKFIGTL